MATLKVGAVACLGSALLLGEWRLGLLSVAFITLALAIQPIIHRILRSLIHRAGGWGETAAIIAGPNRAPALRDYFATNWQYGITPAPLATDLLTELGDGPRGDRVPRIALIAGDTIPPYDELRTIRRKYAEVILLADTPNLKTSGLQPADLNGQIGLRLGTKETPDTQNVVRRMLDLAVAIPAAVASTPLMLIAGAAIYAVDPGPVIYRQAREGLKGRTVHVLKLRTMYKDAEQRLDALLRENPAAQAEWFEHFKLRNDPRILPIVGSFLRSTGFDELPQLINVIAGDMRIVGPRPFPDYHLSAMKAEFRAKRCSVTPGLTGLWQISARSDADIDLQQQLDEFYIDNMSCWFDWYIILNTFAAPFKRRGAY
jgi:lipopolysaccharide/colanic/teichoic acid biosynthesis glycosyltransferase